MDSYKIRITINNNTQKIIDWIKSFDQYVYVIEGHTDITVRNHFHIWIFGKTTRYELQKLAGNGNKWYSRSKCKEKYPFEYWNYMEKTDKPFYKIPTEIMTEYLNFKEELKELLTRKRRLKVWEQIFNMVNSQIDLKITEYTQTPRNTLSNLRETQTQFLLGWILNTILTYHSNNKLVINKHRIFQYMDTIRHNLDPKYRLGIELEYFQEYIKFKCI